VTSWLLEPAAFFDKGVRAAVADHLGRAPTRAELTTARRAAHSLAARRELTTFRLLKLLGLRIRRPESVEVQVTRVIAGHLDARPRPTIVAGTAAG
jgi:hypothetical protein